MRIITGTAKGCRLETLTGLDTRPTAERVKEGLFSAIGFEIEGRRVLDLFAGSGQMGLEALSRGAESCVFVDSNREAAQVVRRNMAAAYLTNNAVVLCREALGFLAQNTERFDLVFLDPPYAAGLLVPCLEALSGAVTSGGAVLCESDRETTLPEQVGSLCLERTYRYGRVVIHLYRCK